MRTFFALGLPETATVEIDRWRTVSLPPFQRPVVCENLHLTLLFLGDISEELRRELEQGAAEIHADAFDLTFDSLGYWPKQEIAFLAPAETPDALATLASDLKRLAQRLGIRVERRAYQPHLTLARRCAQPPSTPILAPDFHIPFDSFELVESQRRRRGVQYVCLADWWLSGTG